MGDIRVMCTSVYSAYTLAILNNACYHKDSAQNTSWRLTRVPSCQYIGWQNEYNTALRLILYVTVKLNIKPKFALTGS